MVRAPRAAPKRNIDVERRAQIGLEKRARTRADILEAAFALLGHEKGLSTPIEEICAAAHISRGTFYNYFDNMQELFDALSYELNHEFNTAVTVVLNRMPDASHRVGAAVRYYLERARKDPKWAWAMVNISTGGPIFGADTYKHAQATAEEGIAEGAFELTTADSGRDLQLGATLAAMITQLRGPPSPSYPATIARHVLLAFGVARDRVETIVSAPLADPMRATKTAEAPPPGPLAKGGRAKAGGVSRSRSRGPGRERGRLTGSGPRGP